MLYKVTDKDIASIKATSKGICLQKGIPEMSSNNGGMSYNPNFTINAANKGDLDIFNKRAKEYIQSKGGLLGFVEKLTTISSMIRSTNSSAYSKVDEVSEVGKVNDSKIVAIKDSDKNTKGSENNIKGVVLIILIVASLFIAIYYLNKREVNG